MTAKPVLQKIDQFSRVLHLPVPVNEEVLKVVTAVEGVTFMRPNPWGKYEIGFEVGRCFCAELVEENVSFAVEGWLKGKKVLF